MVEIYYNMKMLNAKLFQLNLFHRLTKIIDP